MVHGATCAYCRKELDLGVDLLGVHHGVLGHRRFIPLDDLLLFCSEDCVHRHFDHVPSLPPRIP